MSLGIVTIKPTAANQYTPDSYASNLVAFNPDINRLYILDYVGASPFRIKYSDNLGSSWTNLSGDLITIHNFPRLLLHKASNILYIVSVYNNPNVTFNIQKFSALDGSLIGSIDIVAQTQGRLPEAISVSNFVSDWDVCPTTGELVGVYWCYSDTDALNWVSYLQSSFDNLGVNTQFRFIDQSPTVMPLSSSMLSDPNFHITLQPSVCVSNTEIHVFYTFSVSYNYTLQYAYKLISDPADPNPWASHLYQFNTYGNAPGPITARCDTANNVYFMYKNTGAVFSKLLFNRTESILKSFANSVTASCTISVFENTGSIFFESAFGNYYLSNNLSSPVSLMAGITTNTSPLSVQFPRRYLSNNVQSNAIFNARGGTITQGLAMIADTVKPPAITSSGNINAIIGLPYHYISGSSSDKPTLNSDVTTPVTWSVVGTVPNGFAINAITGVISWTPNATGNASYTIRVDNVSGHDQQTITVNVAVDNPPAILNIVPVNNSINVSTTTNISFTLADAETTVDGTSIIVKINGAIATFTKASISNGYNVVVAPPSGGYIEGNIVSVYVKCADTNGHYLETTFSFMIQYISDTSTMVKGWNFFAIPVDDSINSTPAYVAVIGTADSVKRFAYKISKTFNANLSEVDFNNDPTIGVVEEIRIRDAATQVMKRWNPSLSLNNVNEINGTQSYFIKIKDVVGTNNINVVFTGRSWTNSPLIPTALPLKKGENWVSLIPGGYVFYSQIFTACPDVKEIQRFNTVRLDMETIINGFGGDFPISSSARWGDGCILVLKNDSTSGLSY